MNPATEIIITPPTYQLVLEALILLAVLANIFNSIYWGRAEKSARKAIEEKLRADTIPESNKIVLALRSQINEAWKLYEDANNKVQELEKEVKRMKEGYESKEEKGETTTKTLESQQALSILQKMAEEASVATGGYAVHIKGIKEYMNEILDDEMKEIQKNLDL